MKKFSLNDMPPAKTLRGYMETRRKRALIDGWLAAAMLWAQRILHGPKEDWAKCVRASLIYARAIYKMDKSIRACERLNFQLRLRARVLASKEGKAWARSILGEANIRRWKAKHAQCKKTGFLPAPKKPVTPKRRAAPASKTIPYKWKLAALPQISKLFFPRINPYFPVLPNPLRANGGWTQPRMPRGLKPAVFWPFELEDDYKPEPRHIYRQYWPRDEQGAETGTHVDTRTKDEKPP